MKRRMHALSDRRGLTLIEVLMAMLVSFIVFLGLTETIVIALDTNVRNALRDEAGRVAEEQINAVRSMPFASVVVPSAALPASDNVVRRLHQMTVNYGVTRRVVDTEANMKQVFVTVAWQRVNRKDNAAYSITFTTIVRNR